MTNQEEFRKSLVDEIKFGESNSKNRSEYNAAYFRGVRDSGKRMLEIYDRLHNQKTEANP